MQSTELLAEIHEANLTYLMLAQQMLREDRVAAIYRLGIGADAADIIAKLSPAQISRMAASNTLICRFRCDDRAVLELLAGYGKAGRMAPSHAAILMSGAPAATMA
jgi:flagellar transcriptional activator FlhD